MIKIGEMNRLKIAYQTEAGVALHSDDGEELFLYEKFEEGVLEVGEYLEVFAMTDAEHSVVVTTKKPLAMVGEFALLEVLDVQPVGAFLNWGLSKDLFVPHGQQATPMQIGASYLVGVYLDNSGRIAGSSKINRFLGPPPASLKEGQAVSIIVSERTDLGFNVIVEGQAWGLLYTNEVFQDLFQGQKLQGFVKKLRDDDKIDISLKIPKFDKNTELQERIVAHLKENDGRGELTDKSAPREIYKTFQVSKSQYKNALGMLYRQKRIKIEKTSITLLETESPS